jgi:peptidoglycan lytic transglycosylase D
MPRTSKEAAMIRCAPLALVLLLLAAPLLGAPLPEPSPTPPAAAASLQAVPTAIPPAAAAPPAGSPAGPAGAAKPVPAHAAPVAPAKPAPAAVIRATATVAAAVQPVPQPTSQTAPQSVAQPAVSTAGPAAAMLKPIALSTAAMLTTPESLGALGIIGPPETASDGEADADPDATAPDGTGFAAPDGIRPGPRPDGRPLRLYRNPMVDSLVRFFDERRRDVLERGWRRSGRYLPMIRRVFRAEGVPPELGYLAAVESNFNPHARSPARAVGLWQFTAPTARKFGLRMVRPWYDERLDPQASTRAAARLLAYLYDRYEDWALDLAAYNAGEARVNEALARAQRRGRPADYWSLRLPQQTEGFVPSFLAIAAIMEAPQAHGLEAVARDEPLPGEAVELSTAAALPDLAGRLGIPPEQLALRNPAWRRGMVPALPALGPVRLWVPPGKGPALLASLASDPPKGIPWLIYTVAEGDTVSDVARRFAVRTGDVLALNNLSGRSLLAIGQPLLVPVPAGTAPAAVAAAVPGFTPETGVAPAGAELRVHRVLSGESLWSIARQYGVRMAELRQWNGLSGSVVQPDQQLAVYVSPEWAAAR